MKKIFLFIAGFFFIVACEQESSITDASIDANYSQTTQTVTNGNGKVDICHNGHIINVSVNAIPAHQAHGDAMDLDGDGYFNAENECSPLVEDCDDDPTINPGMEEICDDGIDNNCDGQIDEGCCPEAEAYCGLVTYFEIEVSFNGDCTVDVVFNNTPCVPVGATWTLISAVGNVYTYLESDPCGVDGCIATVVDNGGSLDLSYECDGTFVADGTLFPCE